MSSHTTNNVELSREELEREQLEQERLEQERLDQEQLEQERLEQKHLDRLSNFEFNGSAHPSDSHYACCLDLADAAEAASLEAERLDTFMKDAPPFVTRGTTVSAQRETMSRSLKNFDLLFNSAATKA